MKNSFGEVIYNKKHKQTVEVELINPPEFGKLDAWFVMKHLESTEKYKTLIEGIEHHQIRTMISKLYEMGEIDNIQ